MFTKLIITHKNCVDGCACRAIFEKNYGSSAQYIEVEHADYNEDFPEKKAVLEKQINAFEDKHVIMADICLPFNWLKNILDKNNHLTILDHHHTAKPFVQSIVDYAIAQKLEHKLDISFSYDNTESGAMLSWKYMYSQETPSKFIQLVSDADLWTFNLEDTKGFYTGLLLGREPQDVPKSQWIDLLDNEELVEQYVSTGAPIYQQFMQEVDTYAQKATPVTLSGYTGYMVIAPSKYRSELGNALALKNNTFGLVVDDKGDYVTCSLRSVAPFTVDSIAQKFGGGGHQLAAAFRVKNLEELYTILKEESACNSTQKIRFKATI